MPQIGHEPGPSRADRHSRLGAADKTLRCGGEPLETARAAEEILLARMLGAMKRRRRLDTHAAYRIGRPARCGGVMAVRARTVSRRFGNCHSALVPREKFGCGDFCGRNPLCRLYLGTMVDPGQWRWFVMRARSGPASAWRRRLAFAAPAL